MSDHQLGFIFGAVEQYSAVEGAVQIQSGIVVDLVGSRPAHNAGQTQRALVRLYHSIVDDRPTAVHRHAAVADQGSSAIHQQLVRLRSTVSANLESPVAD